ncbi:transcription termination factor MTERF2, chloroplastic-like [Cynara cardunculus var. scolymus]|uniref:Mitochodrial transcription termination factor-related protein n=1 Tax=Cynara cardunculus var. scolymus TaxID=59895 RepID=A0A103XIR1_CYNCS|nr:transcription termination factor MTERF2, chloroplastic-like [Cynara cardunculus var. scolymus]KVH91412.1 Mitochodrial transcription termination factor-related protein [Cynara cardunculus var. scolymus]
MATLFSRYLHSVSSSSTAKSSIVSYLTDSLGFSKPKAQSLFNRFSSTETDPQSVILFFESLGFTKTDIRAWVNESPQILFSGVEETLKPRIQFFQDLGLTGSDLGKFISKNPVYLSNRFEERLKPCVDVIEKLMVNDHSNETIIRTLKRCNWVDLKNPVTRISANIKYLEECGIVGSQLVMVMKRQPRLLIMGELELRALVSKVLDMGFSIDSRMLVHALHSISCMSDQTVERKFQLFQTLGFTEVECLDMFKRAPGLLRVSESKLKLGIEFFLNTVKFERAVLVRRPTCLMLSLEKRVIPRYNILHILASKRLLKKTPKFLNVVSIPEDEFLDRFIFKNRDDAEKLLLAYKGG